ncbi:NAD(P)-binding domain-containing protein, partial [Candidatus Nitrosocosmicus agrestis]|uniref:NAD(P)-binding domain-containing protein n=2 Tax=Candidatus Nitrosocosmicus agrestis TaxID=2563600 RepID=UPI0012546691
MSNENKFKNFLSKPNKVVIIGLGQLGLPVAKYVKEHGFDTYGYDINQKAMQSAETN